jgi:hypothetical protein
MDIQNLSPEVQARWDAWLEHRIVQLRDAVGDALGETRKEIRKQHDDDMAKLRQEMRDSPPLFSAPDRRLAAAMTRVGEELHAQKEGIDALRATATEYVKRADLGGIRLRLERRIGELERQNESIEKNLHSAIGSIFNLSTKLERMHELLARFAAAADCENVLNAVDRSKLPQAEEQQKSADILRLEDLRRSA